MVKQIGPKTYEVTSCRNMSEGEEAFSVRVYINPIEKLIRSERDSTIKGLAKKIAKEFYLEDADEVRTKPDSRIKVNIGVFSVSKSQLIEFYNEFKRYSMMRFMKEVEKYPKFR